MNYLLHIIIDNGFNLLQMLIIIRVVLSWIPHDPYNQLTLIEAENIDYYNTRYNLNIPYKDFRRNIITRGIELNNLIGKKIKIGNAEVEGVDLCRPCRHLTEVLDQNNILKEFLRRGGLRCQILNSSKINLGDPITIQN